MKTPYTQREKLAGLFILAGLLAGFAITVVIGGGQDWFRSYNRYYAIFNNGYGLESGVKVKYLRTDIGLVTRLELTDNNKVKVHLSIRSDFADRVKTDSVANINSPTLIGSEFVDILPGSARTASIPAGGQIPAVERKDLSELVEDLHLDVMLARVEDTMTHVASLTGQLQEPTGPLMGTMSDIRQMTSTVVSGQGSLGKVLYDIEAYGKLNHSLDDVNAITGNVSALTGSLNRGIPPILSQVEQGTRHLPEIGRGAREGIRGANQVLESVKRNFLIRGNLPDDPPPETLTVPARQGF